MRQLAGKLCGVIPFGVVLLCQPFWASRLATRLSDTTALVVAPAVFALVSLDSDPFAADARPSEALFVPDVDADADAASNGDRDAGIFGPDGATARRTRVKSPRAPTSRILPSLRVSKAMVLKFAQAGIRPTGKPVSAAGPRPSGIQVFGAGALGIGVRDGDILTQVNGVPVASVAQVVALVIAARGAHQPQISGQLWRGFRRYSLVVEQPYLQPGLDAPDSSQRSQRSVSEAAEGAGGSAPVARLQR